MFSHTSLKKLEILLFLALIVGGFYYLYTLYALGAATVNVTPRDPLSSGLVGHWTFDGPDMTQNVADVTSG
ncbi:MAG: hypothetical protein CO043_01575, partial [Parcubacteria group bacterium CG_4_9_14_0_2_um_filter_48_40]